jgi:hypothetical protein
MSGQREHSERWVTYQQQSGKDHKGDLRAYLAFPMFLGSAIYTLMIVWRTEKLFDIGSSAFMCGGGFGNRLDIYVCQNTVFINSFLLGRHGCGQCYACLFG